MNKMSRYANLSKEGEYEFLLNPYKEYDKVFKTELKHQKNGVKQDSSRYYNTKYSKKRVKR